MSLKRTLIICGIILVLLLVLDMLFVHPHVYFWWHGLIGFDFIFGVLGGLLLLGLAKGPVNWLVQHDEHYYEDGGGDSHD